MGWVDPECDQMLITGIAMVIGGAVLVFLGAMAREGKLTRQWVVGLRTEATLSSDEAWDAAHRAGAGWIAAAGVVLAVGGVLVTLTDSETAAGVVALIAAAVMLVPLVIAFRKGQEAARSV